MADFIPVRARFTGLDVTALQEFEPTDTITLSIISGFAAGVTTELSNNSITALGDVDVPTPANNEVLTFNSTSGNWESSVSPGSSAAVWGNITGTLSDQLDLQAALDLKTDLTVFNAHTGDATIHYTQASISITESQISDLQSYLLDITGELLGDLSDVTIPAPTNGQVLTFSAGSWVASSPTSSGTVWGTITGTLSDQPDLQTALNLKVETASNVGGGNGVFAQKVAFDLEFKTLVAGDGIQITPSATELLIDGRREKFFAHNGPVTQTFTTGLITVLFPTVVRSDPAYTYNAGEVTINTAGWYFIEYQFSAGNTGNTRASSETGLTVNSLTVFQPGSLGYAYHRNAVSGRASFSGRILVQLALNDVIRVRSHRDGAGSTLETLPDACRLTIISTGAP